MRMTTRRAKVIPAPRAKRRHEPGRRERLVAVALEVIRDQGLAGTTHRGVAARADVPLGSLTYHFASLDELVTAALSRYVEDQATGFDARLARVSDRDELAGSLADVVFEQFLADRDKLVIAYELYLGAARNAALRELTNRWMRRSRRALEKFVEPGQARVVDALLEGLVLHTMLEREPMRRGEIRKAFRRLLNSPSP